MMFIWTTDDLLVAILIITFLRAFIYYGILKAIDKTKRGRNKR